MPAKVVRKNEVVTVPFHFFNSAALVAGSQSTVIRPDSFGTSLSSISDGFSLYRVLKFEFKILSVTSTAAVGVITSVPNTLPATVASVSELCDSTVHLGPLQFVWSEWVTVNTKVIAGPLPWYHTRAGTFDLTESVCATLVFAGSGTNVVNIMYRGVFQFDDPVPTSATPAQVALRIKVREEQDAIALSKSRDVLLRILGAKPLGLEITGGKQSG